MSKKKNKDCRAVTEELMKELKPGGGLEEFVNFVRKTERENLGYKLMLCFRGNSSPSNVVIYYHNHMVWKLNKGRGGRLNVTISFNHARYTKDWQEKLKILYEKYNFRKTYKRVQLNLEELVKAFQDGINGYLTVTSKKFDKEFVEGTFEILKSIIDDFFEPKESKREMDYFKNKIQLHRCYLEKKVQHKLYLENHNTNDGLLIYDLEFAQKRTSDTKESTNQPDMLGIKYKSRKPEKLVLIEVKCKASAMKNSSGLDEHINKMEEYFEDTIAIQNRIKEANEILIQYHQLRLRDIPDNTFIPLDIKKEICVILTDTAIDYFYKNNCTATYEKRGYKIDHSKNNQIQIYKDLQ